MFFVRFIITLIALFLSWTTIVFLQSGNPTLSSQWICDVYKKKVEIAHNINQRKIVIVSGSNALFGINSEMLQKTFNIPVVNFGVNAGVMLPYTLHKAKEVIERGDIVLMPLEYPMYSYNGVPNRQMIDYIFSRDIDAFFKLTLKEQFYMIWSITLSRVYDGYFYRGGSIIKDGLYRVGNINKYGDQINIDVKYQTKEMRDKLNRLKPKRYGREYNSKSLGWRYLEEFVSWCKSKGIKVIFMPTTIMRFDSYFNDVKERWFYENIAKEVKNRGWIYIGNPYDYMYPKNLYFNTPFHLTNKGREIRTKQIIEDLSKNKELL